MVKTCGSSLERQLKEAILIASTPCDILMNQKGEWDQNMVPTMGTMVLGGLGDWENSEKDQDKVCQPGGRNEEEVIGRNETEEDLTHRQRKKARKTRLAGQQCEAIQPNSIIEESSSINCSRNDMSGMLGRPEIECTTVKDI